MILTFCVTHRSNNTKTIKLQPSSVCIYLPGVLKRFLQCMDGTGGTPETTVGQMDFGGVCSFTDEHREQVCGTLITFDSNNDRLCLTNVVST